jgi:hypothetical protein
MAACSLPGIYAGATEQNASNLYRHLEKIYVAGRRLLMFSFYEALYRKSHLPASPADEAVRLSHPELARTLKTPPASELRESP